jgi:FixJ family two-component response regulator
MTEPQPSVVVIDDDPDIREALGGLLQSVGLQVRALDSVEEFLKSGRPKGPTCLVLDVRLRGRSGLDFQRELSAAKIDVPIIFIHRARRRPHVSPGNERRSARVPDQANPGSGPARRDPARP